MAIDPKAIRRAMMVAKDIAASVSNVPLMRADGGSANSENDVNLPEYAQEFVSGVGRNIAGRAQSAYDLATTPSQWIPESEKFLGNVASLGRSAITDPAGTGKAVIQGEIDRAQQALRDPGAAGEYAGSFIDPLRMARVFHGYVPNIRGLDVYHGTKGTYKPTATNPLGEFDASKVGTGYGAQVYGSGTYLAESPLLAKKYAGETGTIYKANLPDETIGKMLDWNKPLAEQPEILKTIRNSIPKDRLNYFDYNVEKGLTGEGVYKVGFFDKKNDVELSKHLSLLGVPGIKYLNKGAHGTGTSNFVVFPGEEKNVKILERNPGIAKADGGDVEPKDVENDDDYITVYHGTPHRFEPTERNELGEFNPNKIGTGEGNQAFGYGMYFSQNPKVAKSYRENLGAAHGKWRDTHGEDFSLDDLSREQRLALRHLQLNKGDFDKAESDIKTWESAVGNRDLVSALHSLKDKNLSFEPSKGALYTVGIHKNAVEKMLDWDRPFSQQHPDVQKALQDAGIVGKDSWLVSGMRGNEIYNRAKFGAPVKLPLRAVDDHIFAAQRLHEAGIPGIKYLDNSSRARAGGEPTQNFVVFPGSEHHLKIMKREKRGGIVTSDQHVPTVDPAKDIRRAMMIAKAGGGELTQSPILAQTFALENRPAAIVSPRPGKGGGPPIIPEAGAHYDPSLEQDREPWSFSTPDIIGAAKPPPIQHPVFNQPRMRNLANATAKIFKTKGFNDVVEGMTGLRNLTVMPTVGTWKNELEPSFIIQHPDMTPEHAEKIAHLLGFGFQQDAAVHTTHNPDISAGIPAALIGNGKKLSQEKIDQLNGLAGKHGLDFTVTGDGKAAKFLHFGDEVDYSNFLDKINNISESANLPEKYHARTTGDLINAKGYINGIFGASGKGEGIPAGAERSPDLFRGIVDHVLAPYAKAVAGEGYRLSPERLKEAYGLTDEETDHVRNALYPTRKGDRTTIPLMTGEETLDVQPTGSKGKATVGDVLYSLQNRAAAQGQIEPGDYSPKAMDTIARHIADEVNYHVQNSPKSAVGWYDKALKAAMQQYSQIFPEITSDPNKELLFHSILGITSQGNDVFSNSTHAARIYNLVRNGASLPDAVKQLRGSFGDKTRQIEQNLLKLHHLVDNNGYDKMRDVFNRKMTVSEWNKLLNKDETLYGPDGKPLKVDGGKDQKVTGWSVFGPKIGSFINNLHGDYSTLTADLWFSRTWNRLLGYNFVHTPLAEAKQYRDFRDALKAEYYNSNPNIGVSPSYKTENGKIIRDSKGDPTQWDYGNDAPQLSKEDFDRVSNDPDEMLKLAQGLEEKYRKSQYREKSDLRRRAKNWVENRELPEALPRSDLERNFQQNTVEKAQKLLKQKYGMDISIADIQAALWFHEKELFGKLGVASEKAAPADYADAASKTVDAFKNNDLYTVKSRAPKVAKSEIPMPRESGGAVERALQVARQAAGINAMMPRYGRR